MVGNDTAHVLKANIIGTGRCRVVRCRLVRFIDSHEMLLAVVLIDIKIHLTVEVKDVLILTLCLLAGGHSQVSVGLGSPELEKAYLHLTRR